MSKKNQYNRKNRIILGTILLITSAAVSLAYWQPWKSWQPHHIPTKTYSPDLLANDTIPEISQEYPIIQHTFEKGDIKCITTYNITHSLPIYIKRYYPNEDRTEYLILKPLDPYTDIVTTMYELIQHSLEHIGTYEPQVTDMYNSKVKTRYLISHYKARMGKNLGYLSLGIWHRKKGESTERLVGSVTADPHNTPNIPIGTYGSYFTGDPKYTGVQGIMRTSFEALVNHLINTGNIKGDIILIIDKNNQASNNIAQKLHFTAFEAKDHYPKSQWPYPSPIEKSLLYKISKEQWEKYNWQKKALKKEKATPKK